MGCQECSCVAAKKAIPANERARERLPSPRIPETCTQVDFTFIGRKSADEGFDWSACDDCGRVASCCLFACLKNVSVGRVLDGNEYSILYVVAGKFAACRTTTTGHSDEREEVPPSSGTETFFTRGAKQTTRQKVPPPHETTPTGPTDDITDPTFLPTSPYNLRQTNGC